MWLENCWWSDISITGDPFFSVSGGSAVTFRCNDTTLGTNNGPVMSGSGTDTLGFVLRGTSSIGPASLKSAGGDTISLVDLSPGSSFSDTQPHWSGAAIPAVTSPAGNVDFDSAGMVTAVGDDVQTVISQLDSAITGTENLQDAYNAGNTIVTSGSTHIQITASTAGGGFLIDGNVAEQGFVGFGSSTRLLAFTASAQAMAFNATQGASFIGGANTDFRMNADAAAPRTLLVSATNADVGGTADLTLDAEDQITVGGTNAGAIAIGRSGITTDFPSGSTVDFTGATVTGLPGGGGGVYTLVTSEAELIAAAAASDPMIALTTNVTLTANLALLTSTSILVLPGVTWAFGAFRITSIAGGGLDVIGTYPASKITWANNTPMDFWVGQVLRVSGMVLTNNSTSAQKWFCSSSIEQHYENCDIYTANFDSSGVSMDGGQGAHPPGSTERIGSMNNVNFVLAGTGSTRALLILSSATSGTLSNIRFTGVGATEAVYSISEKIIWDGITTDFSGTGTLHIRGSIYGIMHLQGAVTFVVGRLVDGIGGSVTPSIETQFSGGTISNAPLGIQLVSSTSFARMDGVTIQNAFTDAAGGGTYRGCFFIGGCTMSGGAGSAFIGCRFGPQGGGSALNLTVDAASTGTIVMGCRSDVAIVDNGVSTQLLGNMVY